MYANKMEMKAEAMRRMKTLGLMKTVLEDFAEDVLNKSEMGLGILYWLSDKEQKMVKQFENEHECIVYHVILTNAEFGILYDMLYVDKYKEDWEMINYGIKDGYIPSYCKNITYDWCSEFGDICVKSINGGLKRTA